MKTKTTVAQMMEARSAVESELASLVSADGGRYKVATAIRNGAEAGTSQHSAEDVEAARSYLRGSHVAQERIATLSAAKRAWARADGEASFARRQRENSR